MNPLFSENAEVKGVNLVKVRGGQGPALVFINGFLKEGSWGLSEWERGVSEKYPSNPCYLVDWESSDLYQILKEIADVPSDLLKDPLALLARSALTVAGKWYLSSVKAEKSGVLLADLIESAREPDGFILMGHSLGARMIYHLLQELSKRELMLVEEAFLLGGAVNRKETKGWKTAVKAVRGRVVNCYSDNDYILKLLYRLATLNPPAGLGPIELPHEKIVNMNVTPIVNGHMDYKRKLSRILSIL